MHYLDNAATTAVADEVADVACRVLREHFANPSSLYAPGARSEEVIETAREAVAESLGARPGEVVFTSCGTDGDNMAVFGAAKARRAWADHIVATGYEHPAVQNAVAALEQEGWRVTLVQPDGTGCVPMQALVDAVGPKTALVTAMHMTGGPRGALPCAWCAAGCGKGRFSVRFSLHMGAKPSIITIYVFVSWGRSRALSGQCGHHRRGG